MKSTTNITIRGYHIDHFGHVNHGRYVELLEEARWCYLEENRLIDVIHKAEAIHVFSRLEIDYRYPARVFNIFVDHRGKPETIKDRILDIWSDLAAAPSSLSPPAAAATGLGSLHAGRSSRP